VSSDEAIHFIPKERRRTHMKKTNEKKNGSSAPNGFLRWEKVAAEAGVNDVLALPRVDEMNERQHEVLGRNYMLVCLMKAGMPTREAIRRANLRITNNAASKLF
jgi:uncharacterized protein YoaH (UPF0181 family)